MIPPLLHYVWVGGPLPAQQQDFIATWRETNPQLTIQCWNEDNIDLSEPLIQTAYQQKKWAKVADIARLQAVLRVGGIYLDTDFQLFQSLDGLRQNACFCAFQETAPSSDWVCNGVFGAEPGHWFIAQALLELYAMKSSAYRLERPTEFGPKHITRLLGAAGLTAYAPQGVWVKDIFVAPVPWFFPFPNGAQFTPECVTPDTLAAHFWANSWAKSLPFPLRVARQARNHVRRQLAKRRAPP